MLLDAAFILVNASEYERFMLLTLDSIVDLLNEELQLHHQSCCMSVRLPRSLLLHHLEGAVHPVLHIKIIIQELGEVHLQASRTQCELPEVQPEPCTVIEPSC